MVIKPPEWVMGNYFVLEHGGESVQNRGHEHKSKT
jgi:hypothetical protein